MGVSVVPEILAESCVSSGQYEGVLYCRIVGWYVGDVVVCSVARVTALGHDPLTSLSLSLFPLSSFLFFDWAGFLWP